MHDVLVPMTTLISARTLLRAAISSALLLVATPSAHAALTYEDNTIQSPAILQPTSDPAAIADAGMGQTLPASMVMPQVIELSYDLAGASSSMAGAIGTDAGAAAAQLATDRHDCDTANTDNPANYLTNSVLTDNVTTASANKPSTLHSASSPLIACMIEQLGVYQQSDKRPRQQYFAYKAQAWLSYANYQLHMNSGDEIADYAYAAGRDIFEALQADNHANNEQALELVTDIPEASAMMRPDIWAMISALKDDKGINIAPRELAYGEVALIWAAAQQCTRGWRESSPYFRLADRWVHQAQDAFVNARSDVDSVALGERANRYYQQYAPLDPHDDRCQGQSLPVSD